MRLTWEPEWVTALDRPAPRASNVALAGAKPVGYYSTFRNPSRDLVHRFRCLLLRPVSDPWEHDDGAEIGDDSAHVLLGFIAEGHYVPVAGYEQRWLLDLHAVERGG